MWFRGYVERVRLIEGVVLEVGDGQVQAADEHLRGTKSFLVLHDQTGELGLTHLQQPGVLLQAILEVHLAPLQHLGGQVEVHPGRTQDLLRATLHGHHQLDSRDQTAEVMTVTSLGGRRKRHASLLASLRVETGALEALRQPAGVAAPRRREERLKARETRCPGPAEAAASAASAAFVGDAPERPGQLLTADGRRRAATARTWPSGVEVPHVPSESSEGLQGGVADGAQAQQQCCGQRGPTSHSQCRTNGSGSGSASPPDGTWDPRHCSHRRITTRHCASPGVGAEGRGEPR
mmetsp:Transcript_15067/g.52894  ORF Transcript_15067/g.52894 Transcript_15067/m.52894 type:complete len:292 (-) Transcript_15067:25-900(-)